MKLLRSILRRKHGNFFIEPKSITSAENAFHTLITHMLKMDSGSSKKCDWYDLYSVAAGGEVVSKRKELIDPSVYNMTYYFW